MNGSTKDLQKSDYPHEHIPDRMTSWFDQPRLFRLGRRRSPSPTSGIPKALRPFMFLMAMALGYLTLTATIILIWWGLFCLLFWATGTQTLMKL